MSCPTWVRALRLAALLVSPPLSLLLLHAPAVARAQPAEPAPAAPEYQTTVTALRLPRPLPDVPGTVTVLPREELERTPGLGLDELVRLVPAATTFRRTPSLLADPTAQGLSLRAVGPSGVSRALVLVDGVPANDPFGGWIYWRALPRLGLDRIEVAPGGSSALYGNYALGGVVQLASRPLDPALELDVSGGNLGTAAVAGRAAGRRGPFAGALEIDGLRSDGYVPVAPEQRGAIDRPGDSRHLGGSARGELRLASGLQLGARAALFAEEQNGGTRLTTADVTSGTYALTARRAAGDGAGLELAAFGSVERFEQTRPRIAPGRTAETTAAQQRVESHGEGASATFTSPELALAGRHRLMVGADLRRVSGTSREVLSPAQPLPEAVTARLAGGEQLFAGMFLQELFAPLPLLELSAALRVDWWSNREGRRRFTRQDGSGGNDALGDRSAGELSPRLGLLLRPSAATRVRAAAYRAFRAPNLNELYRPFQVGTTLTAANEALRAERLTGAELGLEWLWQSRGSLRLGGYWSLLDDPIANVTLAAPLPDGATRQRQNLGRVRVRGADLSADLRLPLHLLASAAYTLAEAVVTDAPGRPDLLGREVPHAPLHRARLALGMDWPERFQATVQLRAQSRAFEDDLNDLPMSGYAVVDLHAGVVVTPRLTAFASVQNLLDHRYLVGRAGVDTIGPPLLALAGFRLR